MENDKVITTASFPFCWEGEIISIPLKILKLAYFIWARTPIARVSELKIRKVRVGISPRLPNFLRKITTFDDWKKWFYLMEKIQNNTWQIWKVVIKCLSMISRLTWTIGFIVTVISVTALSEHWGQYALYTWWYSLAVKQQVYTLY